MKLQIISDLHLEKRPEPVINKTADMLAILGDIDHYPFENGKKFIDKMSDMYENVFVVLGNHEYYSNDITIDKMAKFIKSLFTQRNVHILCNDIVELNKYTIVGTTLWSFIPPKMQKYYNDVINDYKYINIHDKWLKEKTKFNSSYQNAIYFDNVYWLEKQIEECRKRSKKMIVLSHHAPTFKRTFRKEFENDKIRHCFATNLDYMLDKPIKYWIFGHTHCFTNYKNEKNVRLISNPIGNVNEPTGYQDGFYIEFNNT